MAWIESHQALGNHPKLLKLSRAMGWSKSDTLGRLHLFWHWCLDYAVDGQLDKHGPAIVADVFNIAEQDRDKFLAALHESEFVDSAPQFRVHDWWDYAGRFLQVRYKRTPKVWKEIKRLYGHSIQRTNNRTTTELPTINNHKPNQPNLTRPNQTKPNPTNRSSDLAEVPGEHSSLPKSAGVWEAYRSAYRKRYGEDPVRNKSVNVGLCQVIDKLGAEEAPAVAAYYLTHNGQWYVTKMHPVNLLVADAEKLRTEWATGKQVTATQARQADSKAARGQVWQTLIDEAARKELA